MSAKSEIKELRAAGIVVPKHLNAVQVHELYDKHFGAAPGPDDGAEEGAGMEINRKPPESQPEPARETIPQSEIPAPQSTEEPPMDPQAGDKTTVVVKWRRTNWSAEKFEKVYGGRKL